MPEKDKKEIEEKMKIVKVIWNFKLRNTFYYL